jgi:hypothetical protein
VDYCYSPDEDYIPPAIIVPEKPEGGTYYFDHAINKPEKCEIFAADLDEEVWVPFGGESGKCNFWRL